jgi:hypothetical protein
MHVLGEAFDEGLSISWELTSVKDLLLEFDEL